VKLLHLDSVNLQGNIGIGTKDGVKEQRMARAKQICILLWKFAGKLSLPSVLWHNLIVRPGQCRIGQATKPDGRGGSGLFFWGHVLWPNDVAANSKYECHKISVVKHKKWILALIFSKSWELDSNVVIHSKRFFNILSIRFFSKEID